MKTYPVYAFIALLGITVCACEPPNGEIKVRNSIHGAVVKDVRWGDIFLAERLLPGETSITATIYDKPDYGVDLPAAYPIKFSMEVSGDLIYLETREPYALDVDQKIEVVLDDMTRVFNPLLE